MKEPDWLASISDMMSGLMTIFLFISISYMYHVSLQNERIMKDKETIANQKNEMKKIAQSVKDSKILLHEALINEFKNDLLKWNAEIDNNNTVRFKEPKILFNASQKDIKKEFKDILISFFPRYVKILTSDQYENDIEEIRVEGHTSTDWEGNASENDKYLNNAKLSQDRAFEVLNFCFTLNDNIVIDKKNWLTSVLRANGLSYAKLIYNTDGSENKDLSRRVEFRVITKTEEKIMNILKISKGN